MKVQNMNENFDIFSGYKEVWMFEKKKNLHTIYQSSFINY